MQKAILLMMVSFLLITACAQNNEFEEFANQSANQQEFVEQVVKDNKRLRSDKQSLEQEVNDLKRELRDVKDEKAVLDQRVDELTERLETPPGPQGRVEQEDIRLMRDEIIIKKENTFAAVFENTDSMEPVLNENSIAVQVQPDEVEIRIGDIIAFNTEDSENVVVHRIIATGRDGEGWFAITKGDNNAAPDPGKARQEDILGVTVAIIY